MGAVCESKQFAVYSQLGKVVGDFGECEHHQL